MTKWPMRPLGEVAQVIMGQSPPGSTYNTEHIGLPFFQGKAEFGEESPTPVKWCSSPSRVAESGDVLLSVRAPVGPTNYAAEMCCIGRGLAAIRGDRRLVNQRYLGYFLKRFESELSRRGVGSTFSAINRHDIEGMQLPVPPLTEQERIVAILDEADAIRKLRAQADQRTADLIPALFHQMFGDPVTNPVGWPVASLGDIVSLARGGTPSRKNVDFWDGDVPWVSPKDMKSVEISDSQEHISNEAVNKTILKLVPALTVLMVVRGMILAHTVPVGITCVPVAVNQDMKALLLKREMNTTFLCWELFIQQSTLLSLVSTAGPRN